MIQIPINDLYIDPCNIRTDYEPHGNDENTMDEFTQNIKTQGLMIPLSVRPDNNGKYKIYAGSRRFKAIQKLGWKKIPCIISNISDEEAKIKSLTENLMRQENTYSEKTKAFSELYKIYGDLKKMAEFTGMTLDTLKRYIKISNLPDTVLEKLDIKNGEKRLTLEVAEKISKYSPNKAEKLANLFLNKDLSSRDMKTFINQAEEQDIDLSDDEENDAIIANIRIEKAQDSGFQICNSSHLIVNGENVKIDDKYVILLYKYYQKISKESK